MTEEEQLKLLATDGMLVKRPLVVTEDMVLTGFKEAEWKEKLGGSAQAGWRGAELTRHGAGTVAGIEDGAALLEVMAPSSRPVSLFFCVLVVGRGFFTAELVSKGFDHLFL